MAMLIQRKFAFKNNNLFPAAGARWPRFQKQSARRILVPRPTTGKGFLETLHKSGFSGTRVCTDARSLSVTTRHGIPLQPGV